MNTLKIHSTILELREKNMFKLDVMIDQLLNHDKTIVEFDKNIVSFQTDIIMRTKESGHELVKGIENYQKDELKDLIIKTAADYLNWTEKIGESTEENSKLEADSDIESPIFMLIKSDASLVNADGNIDQTLVTEFNEEQTKKFDININYIDTVKIGGEMYKVVALSSDMLSDDETVRVFTEKIYEHKDIYQIAHMIEIDQFLFPFGLPERKFFKYVITPFTSVYLPLMIKPIVESGTCPCCDTPYTADPEITKEMYKRLFYPTRSKHVAGISTTDDLTQLFIKLIKAGEITEEQASKILEVFEDINEISGKVNSDIVDLEENRVKEEDQENIKEQCIEGLEKLEKLMDTMIKLSPDSISIINGGILEDLKLRLIKLG